MRYEAKGVWHGTFDGAQVLHWNEPHTGDKLSVVAYSRDESKWRDER